ncbi:MAG: plasmid pRiA4b ORF-3 family protein [Desulfovibrio sp.]|nr:plasmid pRiA4b ORF-3 family protein [Desulfovibrio sp.]
MSPKKSAAVRNVCIRLRIELLAGAGQEFEDDYIVRVIDMRPNHTLAKLHAALFKAFDRYDDHMYEFSFGADRPYSENAVRYGIPMDDDAPFPNETKLLDATKTSLASLALNSGDVFYYLFDFGDDWWHRITVESVDIPAKTGRRYPLLVEKHGESPDQYEEFDEGE